MPADGAEFGARLRAGRLAAGLSQQELAERSDLSIRTISNLERGRAKWPHPDTVRRLADALGLPEEARAEFVAVAGRRLASGDAGPVAGEVAKTAAVRVVPRQLPAPVRQFTGRRPELAALTGLLSQAVDSEPAATITAIGGMAGVGKTALAVHWAHRVARRFPDGQLYADLRGYDPSASPMPAGEALAGFLRALGMAGQDIPREVDERAAVYRTLLAGRRLLVVLDNARHAEQVRPLLPGNPACVTLVTSRDALGGLVAGEGAVRLEVGLLPLPEAVGLLRGLIGRRVDDDLDAAVKLAGQCGRLPLALRVAAQLAVTRGGVPLADLAAELADLQHRLDLLETGGDERTTVRAVFTWSYQDLDPAVARMFRLVGGVHPGPDISAPAAASLAGLPPAQTRQALGELTRAHLLAEHAPGRFSCHDLLRGYAAEQAAAHDSPAEQRAALHRVLDHYLHTAYAADRLLHPSRESFPLPSPQPGTLPEQPADPDEAMAWFDAEYQALLAAVACAARSGFRRHAWQLPWSLATFLDLRGDWEELTGTQRTALAAATSLEDRRALALTRNKLGFACLLRGQYTDAAEHFDQALEQYQQLGDQRGEACVHLNVSFLLERQDRPAAAIRHDKRALSLFEAAGYQAGQAVALNAEGWHLTLLGRHQQALARCEQALALQREGEDRLDEANTWDSLGYIHGQLGQYEQATDCYQQALELLAPSKERYRQAIVLTHLGDTHHTAGHPQAAGDAWRQALAIFDDLHHPDAETVRAKLAAHAREATPQRHHIKAVPRRP
jgi:tetratricopeptide (TPR) repeat protein/transcriptional regulator with XRE-family HTH domain